MNPPPPDLPRGLDATTVLALLDAAPDGLLLVGPSGEVILANHQAEVLFGYGRGDLVGRSVERLIPREARRRHVGLRAGYAVGPQVRPMGARAELSGLRRSGDTVPVEISLSPVRYQGESAVIAAVRDVTERRAASQALSEARNAVAVSDDRERIARDLHDTVIQRLFAAGMTLQRTLVGIHEEAPRLQAEAVIDQLDETIEEIRRTIFSLQMADGRPSGLRGQLIDLALGLQPLLGFAPTVRFSGAIETLAPEIAEQLLPTLREALTNVGRHARASAVIVHVEVGGEVNLSVTDDGVGLIRTRDGGRGLANMEERATGLGGTCEVRVGPSGGTELRWRVPAR